jgi:GTPase SAR1 family protein
MCEYKLQIVGVTGVGKTTFINRLVSGEFSNELSDEQIICSTFRPSVKFHTTTTSTDSVDMLDKSIDGLFLMFDLHDPKSFDYLEQYFSLDKPMVLVGNKYDVKYVDDRSEYLDFNIEYEVDVESDEEADLYYYENRWYVKKWRVLQKKYTKLNFFEISSKMVYNIEKPFNALIKEIR